MSQVALGERLYSQLEAARLLSISDSTVSKLRREGVLQAVLIGKRFKYAESVLQAYLNGSDEKRIA